MNPKEKTQEETFAEFQQATRHVYRRHNTPHLSVLKTPPHKPPRGNVGGKSKQTFTLKDCRNFEIEYSLLKGNMIISFNTQRRILPKDLTKLISGRVKVTIEGV